MRPWLEFCAGRGCVFSSTLQCSKPVYLSWIEGAQKCLEKKHAYKEAFPSPFWLFLRWNYVFLRKSESFNAAQVRYIFVQRDFNGGCLKRSTEHNWGQLVSRREHGKAAICLLLFLPSTCAGSAGKCPAMFSRLSQRGGQPHWRLSFVISLQQAPRLQQSQPLITRGGGVQPGSSMVVFNCDWY